MLPDASWFLLKVPGNEILVVSGNVSGRDALSLAGDAIDQLAFTVHVGRICSEAERQTHFQSPRDYGRRRLEEASSPAYLHVLSLRRPSPVNNHG
jgi:hypothetical protein